MLVISSSKSLSMKIIYILPSLTVRGSTIIFEQIDLLAKQGHEILLTTLDELKKVNHYPLNIIPVKLEDARKEIEKADAIVAYNPVCAFYVNDIDTPARKYCLLLNDEHQFYTKELIRAVVKADDHKLEREFESQKKYIDASYELDMKYFVPNTDLEAILVGKKRKVVVFPIGVNHELFYPEQYIAKQKVIRLITEGSKLPWKGADVINRALTELRAFELWTFGDGEPSLKTDKHWKYPNADLLRKLFSSSDVFINMSLIDGTAEQVLQAMACGCAVITPETSGTQSFCIDGKNSIIIKGDNPKDLSESLKTKLEEIIDKREILEEIIQGGLETVKNRPWNIKSLEKGLSK